MTCIVGLVHGGRVYMGADSAGVAGLDLQIRSDAKVFRKDWFLLGFTSSFRMGQLLRYSLSVPSRRVDQDVEHYMCTDFVNAARGCLKDGGFASNDNGTEAGGTFLVGYAGRVFAVHGDYQVAEATTGYDACGCGAPFARGALFANGHLKPEDRVHQALEAAAFNSAGVRGPFTVLTL